MSESIFYDFFQYRTVQKKKKKKKKSNMAAVNSVTCTIWLLWRHVKTLYMSVLRDNVL